MVGSIDVDTLRRRIKATDVELMPALSAADCRLGKTYLLGRGLANTCLRAEGEESFDYGSVRASWISRAGLQILPRLCRRTRAARLCFHSGRGRHGRPTPSLTANPSTTTRNGLASAPRYSARASYGVLCSLEKSRLMTCSSLMIAAGDKALGSTDERDVSSSGDSATRPSGHLGRRGMRLASPSDSEPGWRQGCRSHCGCIWRSWDYGCRDSSPNASCDRAARARFLGS